MDSLTHFQKIDFIKSTFEQLLSNKLSLIKVPAPLFFDSQLLLNDMLCGKEKPVKFFSSNLNKEIEIIHSLAKWKRMFLHNYNFDDNYGIYTNMIAIRNDETLDNLHSILVDQWDWEKIIKNDDRNILTLKKFVDNIYDCIYNTLMKYNEKFDGNITLPENIFYITSQELEDLFPNLSAKERENQICKDKKAVFIIGIGNELKSNTKHDNRSEEYDDWNLNGDILVWSNANNCAIELSSMGIRVDSNSLINQLTLVNKTINNGEYQQLILNNILPQTIGGGIGQSRLCMYIMGEKHIGNVQFSIWPQDKQNFLK